MAAMLLLLPPNTKQTKALLERCSNVKELMQIYGQLLKKGTIRNQLTVSTLLASYARIELGNLAYTPMVFDSISSPNTVIWNTMIRAYTQIVMTQKQRCFCTIKCLTTQYLTILTLSLFFSKHVLLSQPLK